MIEQQGAEEKLTTQSMSAEKTYPKRNSRKIRLGRVINNKMNKSIVVIVERKMKHPLYKKFFTKTKRFMAHDEKNEANIGDIVRIMETRPLSARKRWRLLEIVEKAK